MFALHSPAFSSGGPIPVRFAAHGVSGGENLSPPLEWEDEPEGTASFALVCIDRHPVAHNWVHWLVADIPPGVHSLAEGASGFKMPAGSLELTNTGTRQGYGGPIPPPGSGAHHYEFTLYALSVGHLGLSAADGIREFEEAVMGRVLAQTRYTGTFER